VERGRGSALTAAGTSSWTLRWRTAGTGLGGVACVSGVRHPVEAAGGDGRRPHVLLAAGRRGFPRAAAWPSSRAWFVTDRGPELARRGPSGTVVRPSAPWPGRRRSPGRRYVDGRAQRPASGPHRRQPRPGAGHLGDDARRGVGHRRRRGLPAAAFAHEATPDPPRGPSTSTPPAGRRWRVTAAGATAVVSRLGSRPPGDAVHHRPHAPGLRPRSRAPVRAAAPGRPSGSMGRRDLADQACRLSRGVSPYEAAWNAANASSTRVGRTPRRVRPQVRPRPRPKLPGAAPRTARLSPAGRRR